MQSSPQHPDHRVKRVVLPSGKTIEVVYFEPPSAERMRAAEPAAAGAGRAEGTTAEAEAPPAPSAAEAAAERGPVQTAQPTIRRLHVCERCGSDLVHPVRWDEAGSEHWNVMLRCPDCELFVEDVYEQREVDLLDEELDRGTDALVRDLKQLISANMATELDRFKQALDADAILPEDF